MLLANASDPQHRLLHSRTHREVLGVMSANVARVAALAQQSRIAVQNLAVHARAAEMRAQRAEHVARREASAAAAGVSIHGEDDDEPELISPVIAAERERERAMHGSCTSAVREAEALTAQLDAGARTLAGTLDRLEQLVVHQAIMSTPPPLPQSAADAAFAASHTVGGGAAASPAPRPQTIARPSSASAVRSPEVSSPALGARAGAIRRRPQSATPSSRHAARAGKGGGPQSPSSQPELRPPPMFTTVRFRAHDQDGEDAHGLPPSSSKSKSQQVFQGRLRREDAVLSKWCESFDSEQTSYDSFVIFAELRLREAISEQIKTPDRMMAAVCCDLLSRVESRFGRSVQPAIALLLPPSSSSVFASGATRGSQVRKLVGSSWFTAFEVYICRCRGLLAGYSARSSNSSTRFEVQIKTAFK